MDHGRATRGGRGGYCPPNNFDVEKKKRKKEKKRKKKREKGKKRNEKRKEGKLEKV